jgi:hypothetical protein
MLADFLKPLTTLFAATVAGPRDAEPASSFELVDLERRMQLLDAGGYPFHLHSSVVPRDWHV